MWKYFLDLLISVNESGELDTSIFRKETDRNVILHAQSQHPKEMLANIPYRQSVRLKHKYNKDSDSDVKTKK